MELDVILLSMDGASIYTAFWDIFTTGSREQIGYLRKLISVNEEQYVSLEIG